MTQDEKNIVQRICDRFSDMKSDRSVFEQQWDEVAEVTSPRDQNFQNFAQPGEKRRSTQYDSVAELSLNRASAFYDAVTTPRNKRWHGLKSKNFELNEDQEVREYFDRVEDILFQMRYGPGSNYPSQRQEQCRSLFSFGNGIIFTDLVGSRIRHKAIHLSECYIDEDAWGFVDTVYRKIYMTYRQLEQKFGEDKIPEGIKKQKSKNTMEKVQVLHTCEPNKNYDPDSIRPEHRKFISYYILNESERAILDTTGYSTFPYSISRDCKSPREIYGRGIAMAILPNVKMVNQMKKTHIEAAHMNVRPTLLMRDDGSINTVDLRPGRVVAGGVDANGNPTIMPLNHGARFDISEANLMAEHGQIREAFMLDLFVSNVERESTATEILTRSQEQARLLSPMSAQEETESHSVLIERELNILNSIPNLLPKMPDALVEAGGEFEIEFTSPLANSQKADEALGATQTIQTIFASAQFDPKVLNIVNFDAYHRLIAESNSTPAIVLRSKEDVDQITAQQQQQEEAMMMAQAAPNVARAALDGARAQKTMGDV